MRNNNFVLIMKYTFKQSINVIKKNMEFRVLAKEYVNKKINQYFHMKES